MRYIRDGGFVSVEEEYTALLHVTQPNVHNLAAASTLYKYTHT